MSTRFRAPEGPGYVSSKDIICIYHMFWFPPTGAKLGTLEKSRFHDIRSFLTALDFQLFFSGGCHFLSREKIVDCLKRQLPYGFGAHFARKMPNELPPVIRNANASLHVFVSCAAMRCRMPRFWTPADGLCMASRLRCYL